MPSHVTYWGISMKRIETPEGTYTITEGEEVEVKMLPRWARRIGIVVFSPLALAFYLSVCQEEKLKPTFKEFIGGMRVLWNL